MSLISYTDSKYPKIFSSLHCLRPRSSSIPKQSLQWLENIHRLDVDDRHARKIARPPTIIDSEVTVP